MAAGKAVFSRKLSKRLLRQVCPNEIPQVPRFRSYGFPAEPLLAFTLPSQTSTFQKSRIAQPAARWLVLPARRSVCRPGVV